LPSLAYSTSLAHTCLLSPSDAHLLVPSLLLLSGLSPQWFVASPPLPLLFFLSTSLLSFLTFLAFVLRFAAPRRKLSSSHFRPREVSTGEYLSSLPPHQPRSPAKTTGATSLTSEAAFSLRSPPKTHSPCLPFPFCFARSSSGVQGPLRPRWRRHECGFVGGESRWEGELSLHPLFTGTSGLEGMRRRRGVS